MQIDAAPRHLVLEDGTVFPGRAVGAAGVAAGEACFTTASTGYEEAATDPSYVAQVLCFAYPLVGNYGVDPAAAESDRVQAEAIVMRTARPAWAAWLREQGVVAIDDVDTRALVRRIRADGVAALRGRRGAGRGAARARARRAADRRPAARPPRRHGRSRTSSAPARGSCSSTSAASARSRGGSPRPASRSPSSRATGTRTRSSSSQPRAVLIGNGPGDPAVLEGPIATVRDLLGRVPLFGICLGHQLLGLALDFPTFKLPFGHRGANHPVRDARTGRVLVTVQNHGFAVEADEYVSHVSLNDGTVEGLAGEDFATRAVPSRGGARAARRPSLLRPGG